MVHPVQVIKGAQSYIYILTVSTEMQQRKPLKKREHLQKPSNNVFSVVPTPPVATISEAFILKNISCVLRLHWQVELRRYLKDMPNDVTPKTDLVDWWSVCVLLTTALAHVLIPKQNRKMGNHIQHLQRLL
jgi:hypothetical protein